MAKAFAYYRTSSATNVGADKDTLMRQEAAVTAYAAAQGVEIVDSFYDDAVKGADLIHERPAFARMLTAINSNGVRLILVETASRFARDLVVQETGWRFLRNQGIELIACDSPETFLDDTPTAVLIRQVLGAVAQFEKANLVAKLAGARRRTGRLGGRKGIGVLDPKATQMAQAWQAEATARGKPHTLRELSALLAADGRVSSAGAPYAASVVAQMLRQPSGDDG
jgi:DNA invertase Pin-like site-specific DNA recombinase